MAFTEEYYHEKMQLAIQKSTAAENPLDKNFYGKIAKKWAALLPPNETLVFTNNEPVKAVEIERPVDMALRSGETRDARRLFARILTS